VREHNKPKARYYTTDQRLESTQETRGERVNNRMGTQQTRGERVRNKQEARNYTTNHKREITLKNRGERVHNKPEVREYTTDQR
jgi:hypothetical protein